jgi:hypothetical protein
MSYNPKPTRVWSRVQHPCTFTLDSSYNSVFSSLTGKTTSPLEADYYNKLLYKGNILQYKKNTSNLTKSQRYSQICKGMWTNRTKTFATQTQTYTNPNTSNLKRVNFIRVPTNGITTYIHGPYNFNIPAPDGCISDSIKDGGSLLCNTTVNPCTNEVIEVTKVLECYPTSCSDVPGPIIDLCWNSKIDTWYPKQNLTMPTSGTKWPEGYKGFVSAISPYAPFLSLLSLINTTATLNWNVVNNDCIPISSYNIYENGRLIANVPYPTNIYTYTNCDTNTFYVTSISGTTESEPSNTITVTSPPQQLLPPVLSLVSLIDNTATFIWTFVNNDCLPISSFNIYDENGQIIATVPYPTNTATFTVCGNNQFYVTSVSGGTESLASNIVPINNLPFTTTGGPASYTVDSVDSSCNYIVTFTGDGTITFAAAVTITEAFLVGGGNAGLTGKDVIITGSNKNGGWGGQGGGFTILNNISVISPILSISLIVGAGGVYPVSIGSQSSFTYNGTPYYSFPNGTNWAANQGNSGGLNNGNGTGNQEAENGYLYDGVRYGGGGGYGGTEGLFEINIGGDGGRGGGGGGGGFTNHRGGFGGGGLVTGGGTAGNIIVNAGGSSIRGGGGGYGNSSGNGGSGGPGGGAGGLGVAGGGGGGGGVNTGGGGGGGGYPADSGIPGNGGSGIIIIKFTV